MEGSKYKENSGETSKNIYYKTIESRIAQLLNNNAVSKKYADGILERVGLVEGPFSDDANAREKAQQFLDTTVNIIAKYFEDLNRAEMQLAAIVGQVDLLMEPNSDLSIDMVIAIYRDMLSVIEELYEKYPQFSKEGIMSTLASAGSVELLADQMKGIPSESLAEAFPRTNLQKKLQDIKGAANEIIITLNQVKNGIS